MLELDKPKLRILNTKEKGETDNLLIAQPDNYQSELFIQGVH